MANESSDPEEDALQRLLDAFPSACLELIASAYTQANSDPDLAAEIIAFSLNGISSKPPTLCLASKGPLFNVHDIKDIREDSASSGSSERRERLNFGVLHASEDEESYGYGSREVSSLHSQRISSGELRLPGRKVPYDGCKGAKQLPDSITLSHRRPLLRPKGPCPPTLEEYFPSSPEQNAWIQPLSERLQKKEPCENQQNTSSEHECQHGYCPGEFPSLEKRTSKEKGERVCASGLPQPLRSSKRCASQASAAFGLASSARSRSRDNSSTKASPAVVKGSTKDFKQQEMIDEEKSLWPTEAEASLLSMLGEEFSLGIEAVRDVLGHYKGDIEKAFEVLSQLSPSSNDISLRLSQHDKDVAAVTESAENRGISSASKGEISARQVKARETYYAFEEAILKRENSSMKWVVESLCNKYPHADMATLLEVLRATNFDFNDAERMLQDSGLHEGFPIYEGKRDPSELAKVFLESLFSKPQEVNAEIQENNQHNFGRQKERTANLPKIPKWEVVTSTDLDVSGDEEGKAHDGMDEKTLAKFSEMAVLKSEGGNMQMSSYGAWDDYERHHASAKEHWKTMESYLKAANAAYANSDFSKAELLTEKGNMYKQLSMEAKERANNFLLEMNRQSESDFTLDLQDQHVPEALQLLRLHLKSLSPIPSCHTFSVKTGCLEDTKSGHIKIKHEVVRYLKKKGYDWVETSPFCLQVQLKKNNQLKVQDTDQTV